MPTMIKISALGVRATIQTIRNILYESRQGERDNGLSKLTKSQADQDPAGVAMGYVMIVPVAGLTREMDGSWTLGGCSILGTRQLSRIPMREESRAEKSA